MSDTTPIPAPDQTWLEKQGAKYTRPVPADARLAQGAWFAVALLSWIFLSTFSIILPVALTIGAVASFVWIEHYERLGDRKKADRQYRYIVAAEAALAARQVVNNRAEQRSAEDQRQQEQARSMRSFQSQIATLAEQNNALLAELARQRQSNTNGRTW